MTCTSCSDTIAAALKRHQHVTTVSVNLLLERADIITDSVVEAQELIGLVEDAGYDASLSSTTPSARASKENHMPQNSSVYFSSVGYDLCFMRQDV